MARGLGFTETAASGNEYVKWTRVRKHLESLGIDTSVDGKLPDYIPENIFYRLACAVCADANASLMGVQGVRLRLFFQILCGCVGEVATADARGSVRTRGRLYCTPISVRGGGGDLFRRIRRLIFPFSEAFLEDVF